MDTSRILVFSPQDTFLLELPPDCLLSGDIREVVNGQHSMSLVTTVELEKEQRIVTFDGMGKCHEHVISGGGPRHRDNERVIYEYQAVWSLQHDLAVTKVSAMVGTQTPVTAAIALDAVLSGTTRWTRGTVTQSTVSGASMYEMSGWQAMSVMLGAWGGEIDADIQVNNQRIVSRSVDYRPKIGNQTAMRRFDYSRDLEGIDREVSEGTVACRIIPRGKGEPTGEGYGRKIDITSVNDGIEWLQNDVAADMFKLPDGNGGWEYPTVYADNGEIDDPAELKAWGLSVLEEYTTPRVTYTADVVQLEAAGMGSHGVSLGDKVQCVDLAFGGDGLRIEGRVIEKVTDLKDGRNTKLTIGGLHKSLMSSVLSRVTSVESEVEYVGMTTAAFLEDVLGSINAEINATGGYTYITNGQGIRTYDVAVSDPLVGSEASSVVEVKGGSIRIANSKTAQGEWEWKTVFQSGHIAANLVTAANITAGFIGNHDGGNYWDLDNGELRLSSAAMIGDKTLQSAFSEIEDHLGIVHDDLADEIAEARRYATDYLTYANGELTLGVTGTEIKNVITATQQTYRTSAGDVAGYGFFNGVWEMFIETARIQNLLRFGNFAWIARENGNMTLKWIG